MLTQPLNHGKLVRARSSVKGTADVKSPFG